MDKEGFRAEEISHGIRRSLTEKAIKEAERLERFLSLRSESLETVTLSNLEDYMEERTMSTVTTIDVHGLGRFFAYLGNEPMAKEAKRLSYLFTAPFKLRDFLDVGPSHISSLESVGIRTNNQLLRPAVTAEARALLAQELGFQKAP